MLNLQLNKNQIKYFERLIKNNKFNDLENNKTIDFYLNKGIGTINKITKLISYSEDDLNIIKNNINLFYNVLSRGEAQKNNIYEKSAFIKKVHKNEILIKAKEIKINNVKYNIPTNSGILINYKLIKSIENERILIIENYEAFINFQDFVNDYLVIYRGEKFINTKNVYSFINENNYEKIDVFPDFDFYGLNIAKSYKNFNDIYIPHNINLQEYFKLFGDKTQYLTQIKLNLVEIENKVNFNKVLNLIKENKSILLQESLLL